MLYIATTNNDKFSIISKRLAKLGVPIEQAKLDLPEVKGEDNDVTGVAVEKAKLAYNKLNKPLICNDASFFIESLNGFPGINTAFVLKTIGPDAILDLLQNKENRRAEFRIAIAYFSPKLDAPKVFKVVKKGMIAKTASKGRFESFKFNRIFIPDGYSKTLADLSGELFEEYLEDINEVYSKFAKWYLKENSVDA